MRLWLVLWSITYPGHMHFDEWTIMSLRIPDPNNMENPLEWEMVGEGAKVVFV